MRDVHEFLSETRSATDLTTENTEKILCVTNLQILSQKERIFMNHRDTGRPAAAGRARFSVVYKIIAAAPTAGLSPV